MKNLLVLILACTFSISSALAQDYQKDLKNASKTISKKANDPIANSTELLDIILIVMVPIPVVSLLIFQVAQEFLIMNSLTVLLQLQEV